MANLRLGVEIVFVHTIQTGQTSPSCSCPSECSYDLSYLAKEAGA